MSEETLEEPQVPLLETPRDGLPDVIETQIALDDAIAALAKGTGPIAIDAERASGYRYSSRAYLVQIRRNGAGTFLIDPTFFETLEPLNDALVNEEWILHAATQDLVCLREAGIHPKFLFDTEHAGRLLGKARVGLSPLLESELNVSLAKEHSAADWSTRPIPEPWLVYAALDVELLIELREILLDQLHEKERATWAEQDFAYLTTWQPAAPLDEPWRKLSGIHTIRDPRQLAIARDVWLWRDGIARERDKAVGRIVPDAAIVDLAKTTPKSARDVFMLASLRNRAHKQFADVLFDLRTRSMELPPEELPEVVRKTGAIPPPKAWADKKPEAAARWDVVRPAVTALAEELEIAPEVLVSPEPIRAFCWDPEAALANVDEWLDQRKVRPWQSEFIKPILLSVN